RWVCGTRPPGVGFATAKSRADALGRTPSSLPRVTRNQVPRPRIAWWSMRACPLPMNKSHLDSQAVRLVTYCIARGYQVAKVVKEVGAGIHDARPKLLALLADQRVGLIVVEHKDRLTRCGFRSLDTLLMTQGRASEVVNQAEDGTEDWLADLTVIVYS